MKTFLEFLLIGLFKKIQYFYQTSKNANVQWKKKKKKEKHVYSYTCTASTLHIFSNNLNADKIIETERVVIDQTSL